MRDDDEGAVRVLIRIERLLKQILAALAPPRAVTLTFHFSTLKGEPNMPLSMPANIKDEKYYIIGADASGQTGAQLAKGQTVAVVSSDPNTVVLTPDATPAVDNEGVQSVASGSVGVGPTPALNTAVTVTATVTNADGTAAETISDTVTVTPTVPGVATSIGELFEEPVTGVKPAAIKR